ncbi:MAG: hypothetical protein RIQ60_362 [Pseudomonadota bacterium]|jgi:HD-GYP domain-containing protein (c-di-GMP phosphodiesterase class II)
MLTNNERVPLSQVIDLVRVGVPLPFRVLDEHGRMLLGYGQVVIDEMQLAALVARGAWVERPQVQQVRRQLSQVSVARVPSAYHRPTLFDHWEQRVWQLDTLLRKVMRHEQVSAELEQFAVDQIRLVDRDTDVALFMAIRQDDHRFALYALTHGLYTATVALLAGRQLGWTGEQLRCITCSALTMNLSIGELQSVQAEQKTPPTPKQMEQLRSHPQRSADLLRAAGVRDSNWLTTVQDHHERRNGKGYPRGTQEISDLAAVLRAADVYMAKVSPRAQRPAMLPKQAARQLYEDEGGGPIAAALIKPLGIYPPGDLVRLRSGEIAVVVRHGATGATPQVATLSTRHGKPSVATEMRDTSVAEFAIDGLPQDRSNYTRILPERVYGIIEA